MVTFDKRISPVGRRMLSCAKPLAAFFVLSCALLAQASQRADELRLKAMDGDSVAAKELADLYYEGEHAGSTNLVQGASLRFIRRNRTEALKWYEKSATLGNIGAMRVLVKNTRLPLDRKARLSWLKKLVKIVEDPEKSALPKEQWAEAADSYLKCAGWYMRLNDFENGVALLYKYCETIKREWPFDPDDVVDFLMGTIPRFKENGFDGDYPACVRFLKCAIGRDLPRGGKYDDNVVLRVQMGDVYARGIGVVQDLDESLKWYFDALDYAKKHGCKGRCVGLAQRKIGECLRYGKGRPANLVEAVTWYERAALNRDLVARKQFAQWCMDGLVQMDGEEMTEKESRRRAAGDSSIEIRPIVDVDLVRAEELSDLSDYWSRKDRYEAVWRLTSIYMQRDEWNKIVDLMLKQWYYDDSENPFLGNMKYAFALAYRQGIGVDLDKAKYFILMREAAKLGCHEAMIHLDRLGIDYTDYDEPALPAAPAPAKPAPARPALAKPLAPAPAKPAPARPALAPARPALAPAPARPALAPAPAKPALAPAPAKPAPAKAM